MAALPIAIQHGFQSASHPSPSLAHQHSWSARDGGTRSSPWASAGSAGGTGSGSGLGVGDGSGGGGGFGASPIGTGGLYGRSGGQMGLWAPSGSWRGEGWQGLAVPPSSPSNSSLQPGSMGFPSLPSPFQPHSFLPSSPSYSSRGGELSMSVDSAPGTSFTHQDLGNMLAQHKLNQQHQQQQAGSLGGGAANVPLSSSFQGPGSVERLSQLEQNFTSNFTCCGLQLKGLHDLLEHYEESHVLVTPQAQASASAPSMASFQRQPVPRSLPNGGVGALSGSSSPRNIPSASQFSQSLNFGSSTPSPTTDSDAPHTPGMMDLEMDDAPLPSPFPHSSHPRNVSAPANFASPWSSASALTTHSSQPTPQCVPPSLLTYPIPSRGASPSSLLSESSMGGSVSVGSLPTREMSPPPTDEPSVDSPRPAPVPMEKVKKERKKKEKVPKMRNEHGEEIIPPGEKRFRCPIEGCGKVYKQQNGLKYHLQRSINSSHAHVGGLVSSSGVVIPPPPSSVISPSG